MWKRRRKRGGGGGEDEEEEEIEDDEEEDEEWNGAGVERRRNGFALEKNISLGSHTLRLSHS